MIISVHQTPRWSSLTSSVVASSLREEAHASREVRSIRTPGVQRAAHIRNHPGDMPCSFSSSSSTGSLRASSGIDDIVSVRAACSFATPGNARLVRHLCEVREVFKPLVLPVFVVKLVLTIQAAPRTGRIRNRRVNQRVHGRIMLSWFLKRSYFEDLSLIHI